MELACWCCCTVPLQGDAAGCCYACWCCCTVVLHLALHGGAARCCSRVVLLEWRVRCGAGFLWCCFRVLMLEWCVRFLACWCCCRPPLQAAAAGPRCRVLLQGADFRLWCAWVLALFEGVAAVERGCCCRAARCPWQCGVLGLDGDYVYAINIKKAECVAAAQKNLLLSGVYVGIFLIVLVYTCVGKLAQPGHWTACDSGRRHRAECLAGCCCEQPKEESDGR